MPDQLTLLMVDAWGNSEDGWDTNQLFPTGITFEPAREASYYYKELRRHYPNLEHFTISFDDDNYAQVYRHKDGKPLFEIVPENTGK